MSRQIPKQYVTEDGHVFLNQQDAEDHMDVLELTEKLANEFGTAPTVYTRSLMLHMDEVAEWLVDNYELTSKNHHQAPLPAQD